MASETISSARNRLKSLLKDREIIDIVIFGSAVKGKPAPKDIDIAVISAKKPAIALEGFHVSTLSPEEFFASPPLIATAIFREGYSLRHNKQFSQLYKFTSRVLFKYELLALAPSAKVKAVSALRGKRGEDGMVKQQNGVWLANQVFLVPPGAESIFERFFINLKIRFSKYNVLMH